MKELFPGYYSPTSEESDRAWKTGVIVLDTNVLLNLYRYPAHAQEDMLSVLRKLRNRIWLPFHVALEYQQSRLKIIANQFEKFAMARKVALDSRRALKSDLAALQLNKGHSLINPVDLIEGYDELVKRFIEGLDKLKKEQLTVDGPDPIRTKLDEIMLGRVGPEPADQAAIAAVSEEAEYRFLHNVPPGYMDISKGDESLTHNGKVYLRRYGDFIIWKQMLDHMQTERGNQRDLIFVTDDEKEDWWNLVRTASDVKQGPHPQLVQELRTVSPGSNMFILTSEQFLTNARERLKVSIDDDTIAQVREITSVEDEISKNHVEAEVIRLLAIELGDGEVERRAKFPHFVWKRGDRTTGIEVRWLKNPHSFHVFPIVEQFQKFMELSDAESNVQEYLLIIAVRDEAAAEEVRSGIEVADKKLKRTIPIRIYQTLFGNGERDFELTMVGDHHPGLSVVPKG